MPANHPNRIIELKTRKFSSGREARAILDKAEAESRDLSRSERAAIDAYEATIEAANRDLTAAGADFDPRLTQHGNEEPAKRTGDVLSKNESMSDWLRERRGIDVRDDFERAEQGELSFGRLLTSFIRRDRSNLTEVEKRALSEGVDSAGGFLTPETLGVQMIDRLRNKCRIFEAGASLVPMLTDQLLLARLTGAVTPSWKAEGNAVATSDPTFDRVTLKCTTLPLIIRLSQELWDDLSPEAATLIEDEMLGALAIELDRVILRGSGSTPEPKGILNQTGVTLQNSAGNPNGQILNGYSDFATAIGKVRSNNLEPNAAIINAVTAASLDGLKDSTGQPLRPPTSVQGIMPFLVSNIVPATATLGTSGAVCSEAYVAQWDQVLIGMRTDIRVGIRALDQLYAGNLQVGLLVYLRADVQMRHGEAAVVINGIKTA